MSNSARIGDGIEAFNKIRLHTYREEAREYFSRVNPEIIEFFQGFGGIVCGFSDVFIDVDTQVSHAARAIEESRMPPGVDRDFLCELFRACYWADEKAISIGGRAKKWDAKLNGNHNCL